MALITRHVVNLGGVLHATAALWFVLDVRAAGAGLHRSRS